MDDMKVYVGVTVIFTTGGLMIPTAIHWEDGRIYQIARVKNVRSAFSLRAGRTCTRYTCVIEGKFTHLFYEGNQKWFVERKIKI